jgi:hypothetical protein
MIKHNWGNEEKDLKERASIRSKDYMVYIFQFCAIFKVNRSFARLATGDDFGYWRALKYIGMLEWPVGKILANS